jgi:hypothetical protein
LKRYIFLYFLAGGYLNAQNLYISSGVYYNSVSTTVFNARIQNLQKYKASVTSMDFINILFEIVLDNRISLKTGLYRHSDYFKYERYYGDSGGARFTWEGGPYDFNARSIDIPLLLSYNFKLSRSISHIDAGPYFGHLFYSGAPHDLLIGHQDFGANLSFGIGGTKWQFTTYSLIGIHNMLEPINYYGLRVDSPEKARGITIGFNLTRIISFKKNRNSEPE